MCFIYDKRVYNTMEELGRALWEKLESELQEMRRQYLELDPSNLEVGKISSMRICEMIENYVTYFEDSYSVSDLALNAIEENMVTMVPRCVNCLNLNSNNIKIIEQCNLARNDRRNLRYLCDADMVSRCEYAPCPGTPLPEWKDVV